MRLNIVWEWINGNGKGSCGGNKRYEKCKTGIPWLHQNFTCNDKRNRRTKLENWKIVIGENNAKLIIIWLQMKTEDENNIQKEIQNFLEQELEIKPKIKEIDKIGIKSYKLKKKSFMKY